MLLSYNDSLGRQIWSLDLNWPRFLTVPSITGKNLALKNGITFSRQQAMYNARRRAHTVCNVQCGLALLYIRRDVLEMFKFTRSGATNADERLHFTDNMLIYWIEAYELA
jgi:hypothetical protein